MIQRFRIWLAAWLLRPTPCAVARLQPLVSLNNAAVRLREYVERSGAVQDPRRVQAYKILLRATTTISSAASQLLVETKRVQPTPSSAALAATQEAPHGSTEAQAQAQTQSA